MLGACTSRRSRSRTVCSATRPCARPAWSASRQGRAREARRVRRAARPAIAPGDALAAEILIRRRAPPRGLQGAAAGRVHRRPAAHRDRQDQARRAADPGRVAGMTPRTCLIRQRRPSTLALAELTYPEVERAAGRAASRRSPCCRSGSTEAHGPHLPLATDSLISEAVVDRAGGRARGARPCRRLSCRPSTTPSPTGRPPSPARSRSPPRTPIGMVLGTCRAAARDGLRPRGRLHGPPRA